LLADLDMEQERAGMRDVHSVFIGGGTPSLFSGREIERLLDGIRQRTILASDAEVTLEANPGTTDADHFSAYRAAGVNRLSIGVQSFNDRKLAILGRIHSAEEADRAVNAALGAGFDNINLDLMYGLPFQSVEEALADLESAVNMGPTHISWYQLTIEPNTAFQQSPPDGMPEVDDAATMGDAGRVLLAGAGYTQYEVSAYATPGARCRHNLNYWEFGDYIGIGAGAHGKLSLPGGRIERRRKQRHPDAYMDAAASGDPSSGVSVLQDEDLFLEFMMNTLRLNDGVRIGLFEERTGLKSEAIAPRLRLLRERGLIENADEVICATELGRRYLNDLLAVFA
jgi:oxygen-independent coproporphyrinogen-3 oxidase